MRNIMDIVAARPLYEQDEHAWMEQQIALLRDGKLDQLDKESLIQYLTEMTIRDRRELRSRISVLLLHLLKVQFQPSRLSMSWVRTILEQQREIRSILEGTPSIRQYVPDLFMPAYRDAVRAAAKETGIPEQRFPATSPWTLEQALEFDPPTPTRRR